MNHIIAYEGLCGTSLALMQEAYVPLYLPWINRRIGIEGTMQRPPMSLSTGVEWVRGLDKEKGKHEVFAVLVRTGEKCVYVGHTGIHGILWPDGRGVTGSIIGAPSARGRGVGTEAKLLLLKHAFDVLGLRKLTSTVKDFNAASMGHLLKCGYRHVGVHKQHLFHEGKFIDEHLFEVFRENWLPIWENYQKERCLPALSPEGRAWVKEATNS